MLPPTDGPNHIHPTFETDLQEPAPKKRKANAQRKNPNNMIKKPTTPRKYFGQKAFVTLNELADELLKDCCRLSTPSWNSCQKKTRRLKAFKEPCD